MPAPAIEVHLDNEGNGHILVGDLKVPTHFSWDSCEYAEEEVEEKFGQDTVQAVWFELAKAKAAEYRRRFSVLKEEGLFESDPVVKSMMRYDWVQDWDSLAEAIYMRAGPAHMPYGRTRRRLQWLKAVSTEPEFSFNAPFVEEEAALFRQIMKPVTSPPNPYEEWRTRRASNFSLSWAPSHDLDDETFKMLVDALYKEWDNAIEYYLDHDEDERKDLRFRHLFIIDDLDLITMKKCYAAVWESDHPTPVFQAEFDLAKGVAYIFPQ